MSIFNPWGELRALKARLAAEEEAYLIEEAQQQAEWAKKDAMLGELQRANATLRREQEQLRNRITELNEKLTKAVDPRDPKTGRFTKKAK
jgi:response regulator RpfG family c-di-GMP phosphodiesterase